MPKKYQGTIEEFMLEAHVILENSVKDSEILNAVSEYGYTAQKLAAGKKIYDKTLELVGSTSHDHGVKKGATKSVTQIRKKAHDVYMKTLQIARIAFKNDVIAQNVLELKGRREANLAKWLSQANTFYEAFAKYEEFISKMSEFGYSLEKLNTEHLLIKEVAAAFSTQKYETGDAQDSTIERDKQLNVLGEWIGDFKKIARIALAKRPQLLEKLGIIIKST